jgi:hypothetical protein
MRFERFGQNLQEDISADESEILKTAMKNILEVMYWEEKFDYLIENYTELENEIVSITSRNRVFKQFDYLSAANQRAVVARRIANLLTTCRQYYDQSLNHVAKIFSRKSGIYTISRISRESLRGNWQVQFIDQLRNHVQHFGLPFHSITFATKVTNMEPRKIYESTGLYINPQEMKRDKKFDKNLFENAERVDGNIDLMPIIRKYVEYIAGYHELLRSLIEREQARFFDLIASSITVFYSEKNEHSLADYYIIRKYDSEDMLIDEQMIFTRPIHRIEILQKKNKGMRGLSVSFVSSESPQDIKGV